MCASVAAPGIARAVYVCLSRAVCARPLHPGLVHSSGKA
jgi:hypothetical protein